MRQQLIQYVELLFAGANKCEDIKIEILQNTLDRYDDLIAQGKSPEAAYRLAISGIGDINEILNSQSEYVRKMDTTEKMIGPKFDTLLNKTLRAFAIGIYILSPIPLFILSEINMETIGLCGTLGLIAVATVIIILARKNQSINAEKDAQTESEKTPNELLKCINSLIWVVSLAIYFVLSFSTQAWFITWVIFPLTGAVQGLVKACFDLKEANR